MSAPTRPQGRELPSCDHQPAPYDGPDKSAVLALRQQYLTPGLITYYRDPLMVVEGHMQYVWDERGRRYLDAFAGIVTVSVGHCHPYVVEKVREQVGKLQHVTTIYLHPTIGLFGEKLAEHMPADSGLTVSYFTNSGSEANELAVLMAREHTGRSEIISLRNSYHGGTQGTMALTAVGTWKFSSNPPAAVKNAVPGYCYRCPFGLTYPSCDVRCARDVEAGHSPRNVGSPGLFHWRTDSRRGGRRDAAARIFFDRLRPGPQAWRVVHRRRGANGLRPHGRAFLGL